MIQKLLNLKQDLCCKSSVIPLKCINIELRNLFSTDIYVKMLGVKVQIRKK